MYNAPALKKALEIIKLIVGEKRPLGVTEISRALAISKSTTFGILKSLEEEGFVLKIDSTKAKKELGWKPKWDMAHAVRMATLWYQIYYETGHIMTEQDIRDYEGDE